MPQAPKRGTSREHRQLPIRTLAMGGALLILLGGMILFLNKTPMSRSTAAIGSPPEPEEKVYARYAGSKTCRNCHEEEYRLWAKSNHGMAERLPDPQLESPAFSPARTFKTGSQEAQVGQRGSNFVVVCRGPYGTNDSFPVVRVIGHDPLRQFLVSAPGGRLQTLQASYAPRENAWFDVYGNEDRQPGEWGHWTGRGMNWNSMCAGCHNTRLRKNYRPETDSYETRMAEMTVGCESCHGPLKAHNDWQNNNSGSGRKDPTVTRFNKQQVLDNCGFCHARRSDLTGDFAPGESFFDHQSLAVVDRSDTYYPDGQVHEENYEFAAFMGSRMHSRGVYCLDCHNPHSMKTLLPGNWLCLRCHNGTYENAPVIDPVSHSHHKVFGYDASGKLVNSDLLSYRPGEIKETGGECVNCHMPQTVYMQKHRRHDHGFTIPDPLLTKEANIPNACNRCHMDKDVNWAVEATERWYAQKMERPTRQRTRWLAMARAGDGAAKEPLLSLLRQNTEAPYWRGVIVGMLNQWQDDPQVRAALLEALRDSHPLPRAEAAAALRETAELPEVKTAFQRLLADPVRSVRIRAAWALARDLSRDHPAAKELEYFLELNSDQPTGQMQLGSYWFQRSKPDKAVTYYGKAAAWDAFSAPIRHDYAIALSTAGRTPEAIQQLEAACKLAPAEAEYRYKLGLAWGEQGRTDQCIAALESAVKLQPGHARAWFNLGLARNTLGKTRQALEALGQAERLQPDDPTIPYTRATVLLSEGRPEEARKAAERALELRPDYADAKRMIDQLNAQPSGR